MPEHVHLLIGEPKIGTPSTVVHSLKLRVSKRLRAGRAVGKSLPQFWRRRFYDFNIWSAEKQPEKLDYMHRNPVARALVADPGDSTWSTYRSYSGDGFGITGTDYV